MMFSLKGEIIKTGKRILEILEQDPKYAKYFLTLIANFMEKYEKMLKKEREHSAVNAISFILPFIPDSKLFKKTNADALFPLILPAMFYAQPNEKSEAFKQFKLICKKLNVLKNDRDFIINNYGEDCFNWIKREIKNDRTGKI